MKFDWFKGDNISTVIVWGLVVVAAIIAAKRGLFWGGMKESGSLLQNVTVRIAGALLLAGFAQVLIPSEVIGKLLGAEAGWKGIVLAWILGAFAPGGPFVSFPILAVLLTKGASVAAVFTFLSSWSLLGVFRVLSWELPFLGWNLTIARLLLSLWVPLAVGFLTKFFVPKS